MNKIQGNWLALAGVVLVIAVAALSTTGFILNEDKDMIIGMVIGVVGGGAIAKGR